MQQGGAGPSEIGTRMLKLRSKVAKSTASLSFMACWSYFKRWVNGEMGEDDELSANKVRFMVSLERCR